LLKDFKTQHDNLLVLEAGNFCFSSPHFSEQRLQNKLPRARFIAEMYNELPYDVVNIGLYELTGGTGFLNHLKKRADKYKIISANIYNADTQKLILPAYHIKKIGNKKFGIVGITSQSQREIAGIDIKNPLKAAEQQAKYLKSIKKVDYIVLLAALDNNDYSDLIQLDIPVDIVLMALPTGRSRYLTENKAKLIARSGREGKYIGFLSATIKDTEKGLSDISYASYKKSFVERRIKNYEKSAGDQPIEEYLADKDRMKRLYNNLVVTRNDLTKRIEKAVNPVDFDLIPVEPGKNKDKKVEAAIKRFEK